ncbi:MAG: hypothetical protein Q9225_007675 [Loekoesia sp. 1 TL-2023]
MDRDGQQVSKAIPRFTSFRSNVLPTSAPKPGESSGANRSLPSNDHRDSAGKHYRYASKRRPPSPSSASGHGRDALLTSKQQYEGWEDSPKTFTIDVKGDNRNLDYGSSYGVPSYPRPPARVALGSNSTAESIARHTTLTGNAGHSISKQIIPGLRRQRVQRVNASSKPDLQDDGRTDFIPLQWSKSQKRKHEGWINGYTSSWNMESRTRQLVVGETESASFSDEDIDDITNESGSDGEGTRISMIDERLQQKRTALSSKVEQDPTEWQPWIELVELQDEMDGFLDVSSQLRHTNAERRSNAEIGLSIYDKALRSVVDLQGRERLYIGLMSKALEVWERGKTLSKWQIILKEHPLSYRLWREYLDFQQSTFSGFSFEETRKQYLNCLDILRGARERVGLDPAQQSQAYIVQLYILLRFTLLLQEGGYTEVAVAMWQALLEFEFNRPRHLCLPLQQQATKSSHEELLPAFEQFWDSEAPRIGEPRAKGWLNFDENDLGQEQLPSTVELPSPAHNNALKTWADVERKVGRISSTPSRTIDESSDDPYRVTFFSDIKPALIESPTPSDTHILLSAFLCFCHLPPCKDSSKPHLEPRYNDQYIRNELLYDQSMLAAFTSPGSMAPNIGPADNSVSIDNMSSSSSSSPFAFPLIEHQISSDTLFSALGMWFSAFRARTQNSRPIPKELILASLKSLVTRGVGGDDLAEYFLALELQMSLATVTKSAKSLLKTRPSSLRLYNAYALIQYQLGNNEAGDKVIDTAIQMSSKFSQSTRRDEILLWRSRIWQHLSKGQTLTALEEFLTFGLDQNSKERPDENNKLVDHPSASTRLRLRNALSAYRDHELSLGLSIHAVYYAELLVLVDYLSKDTSLHAAQESFKENLQVLSKTGPLNRASEELFRQSFARLLYTHITHKRPFSPSTIRSFLTESITVFPHNTIFLSLYAWNESRFRIDDRVRGIMRDVVFAHSNQSAADHDSPSDNITTHFFAIHTDLHRGLALGSNQNAIRGSFERALRSKGAAHSASLWKLYFLFEHRNGDLKRAREVFYRAVRACPWVKELYMLAFEYLGEEMGEGELRIRVAL